MVDARGPARYSVSGGRGSGRGWRQGRRRWMEAGRRGPRWSGAGGGGASPAPVGPEIASRSGSGGVAAALPGDGEEGAMGGSGQRRRVGEGGVAAALPGDREEGGMRGRAGGALEREGSRRPYPATGKKEAWGVGLAARWRGRAHDGLARRWGRRRHGGGSGRRRLCGWGAPFAGETNQEVRIRCVGFFVSEWGRTDRPGSGLEGLYLGEGYRIGILQSQIGRAHV